MSAASIDPRVVRTKQRLFESLLEMIQKQRWDKIRVQDILNDTGISRSAFYAHFDNKYDLLTSGMSTISVPFDGRAGRPNLVPLFEHVYEASPILKPLFSQPVLSDIIETFHRQIADSWLAYLAETEFGRDEVLAEMMAGSLTAAIKHYALSKSRPPPVEFAAEVSAHFHRLVP